MRQVGTLSNKQEAVRFIAVLALQNIEATCDVEGDNCTLWVHDEDQLATARQLLKEFEVDPNHERYQSANQLAEKRLREISAQRAIAQRNVIPMRGKWKSSSQSGYSYSSPLAITLIVVAGLLSLYTGFRPQKNELVYCTLSFADPRQPGPDGQFVRQDDTQHIWRSIQKGEVWRIWTPMLLHFGITHILFNSLWMYSLGGQMEERRGTGYFLFFILLTGAISNIGQAIHGGAGFGGLSGLGYGIFGYLWIRGLLGNRALALPQSTIIMGHAFLVLCILRDIPPFQQVLGGLIPPIANAAHVLGVLTGMALAWIDRRN